MSRLVYKPVRTQAGVVGILIGCGLASFCYCMVVVDSNTYNFPEQILFCCLTVMVSNLYYTAVTGLQYLHYSAMLCTKRGSHVEAQRHKASRRRASALNDGSSDGLDLTRNTYTVKSIVCQTIDFAGTTQERKLSISREELWYILYPISLGIFVVFFCLPIYDVSCSLMLALGLLMLGSFQECRRDMHWERSGLRRGVFLAMVLAGVVIVVTLFILSYTVNSLQQDAIARVRNTSTSPVFNMTANNIDYIQLLLHNDEGFVGSNQSTVVSMSNSTRETLLQEMNTRDALVQEMMMIYTDSSKLYSFLIRIPVWMCCFYTPFMLSNLPTGIQIPVILEVSQASMGNLCAMVILTIVSSCHISWGKFFSVSTCAYVMIVPFFLWMGVYMILQSSRNKTLLYVACVVITLSYLKFAYVIGTVYHIHSQHVVRTFVFLAFVLVLHVVFSVCFIRSENFAIRLGWDKFDADELGSDSLSDFDDEILLDGEMQAVPPMTIEDVLNRVTSDIRESENVIKGGRLKSAPKTANAAVPDIETPKPDT